MVHRRRQSTPWPVAKGTGGEEEGRTRLDKRALWRLCDRTMAPTGGREDTEGDEEEGKEGDGISNLNGNQDKEMGEEKGGGRSKGRGGRQRTRNRKGAQEKLWRKRRETTMRGEAATAGTRERLDKGSRRSTSDIRGMKGTGSLRGSTEAESRGATKTGSGADTTDIRGMAEKRDRRGRTGK
jgi:hypothetical protein